MSVAGTPVVDCRSHDRQGKKIVTVAASGLSLMVVGFLFMLLVSPTSGFLVFLPGMFPGGIWLDDPAQHGAELTAPFTHTLLRAGDVEQTHCWPKVRLRTRSLGQFSLVSLLTLKGVSNATNGAVSRRSVGADRRLPLTGKSSHPRLSLTRGEIGGLYVDAFKLTSLIIAIIPVTRGTPDVVPAALKASIPVDTVGRRASGTCGGC